MVWKQLWIACKIWAIAVFCNTVSGTLCLTHFLADTGLAKEYMLFGLFFGTVVSFPVFVMIFVIINSNVSGNSAGKTIFLNTLVTGFILTVVVFFLFIYGFNFLESPLSLFTCAIFSCIAGVGSQYKSLIRLGDDHMAPG